jgi:hypothetical protein
MLGMVAGEARSWEFTFPQDWHVDLWRGQTATADIKLVELFSYILPEVRWLLCHGVLGMLYVCIHALWALGRLHILCVLLCWLDLWRGQTATADVKLVELFSYILPEVR